MGKRILLLSLFYSAALISYGQVVTECPGNVGFESGTFANWECRVGVISGTGQMFPNATRPAQILLSPTIGPSSLSHSLIMGGRGLVDPFGLFPLDAPNGSDYVVKLGNQETGRGAESISYTINVPSNVETYSIIFNYAVVFENPPHENDEQPKFTARILDETTNTSTNCGSFEFVAPGAGGVGELPGFELSKTPGSMGSPVFYKPWSPVLVNLTDYRGHTIRLEFTTNDCSRGGHFGYAYVDFNENCSIPITGNVTCPETDKITLKVLPGFYGYNWFDALTFESLGTADSLVLLVPTVGRKIGVELIPYSGLGCTQSLYTVIAGMDLHINDPPGNCTSIDITATSVTVGTSSDLTYTYWRDRMGTDRISDPKHITIGGTYYIKGKSSSGCFLIKEVQVNIIPPPLVIVTNPDPVGYPGTVDITTTFAHQQGETYSYWRSPDATVPLANPAMVTRKGTYYIKAINSSGCISVTPVLVDVLIPDIVIPNTFTPNGDGINDVLTILINSKVDITSFRIYSRWGALVFETPDIENYWTGFKENARVPIGTYYWVIEGDLESKKYRRSGSVTIIR